MCTPSNTGVGKKGNGKKETERRETLPGQEKRETEKGKSFTLSMQSYQSMPRTRYEQP